MEITFLVIFTLLFQFYQTCGASSSNTMIMASSNVTCIQRERQSLLVFKQALTDKSNRLSTWTGVECCEWQGVVCDRRNGHVVKLDLRSSIYDYINANIISNARNLLEGKVSPSLLNLKHLRYLDLSMNNFSGQNIPEFFGSFKYLEYLNLSRSGFSGVVPPHLGNLSRLQYLDLNLLDEYGMMFHPYDVSLIIKDDLQWVSWLSSLKHLDFSGITIGNHIDWFHPVNILPSLLTLNLALCDINISSIKFINFTSLNSIDLSSNGINSTIPVWLSNLNGLTHLNLYNNSFHGGIPDSIGTLSSLSSMDLSGNQLNGSIPPSLGGLSSLTVLDLSGNKLSGVVTKDHFTKLNNLTDLYLSYNSLTLNVSPHWIPPFELRDFGASFCNIGPQFPNWLQTQTDLQWLFLSNSSIRDTIPKWFDNISSHLVALDLSDNQIHGNLPRIRNNTDLGMVYLGNNRFSGSIPTHLCRLLGIYVLDLSNNNFSGVLPKCLGNLIQLVVMDLTNNTITGDIPNSLGSLSQLQSLHLNNNKFKGNLPVVLQNLIGLEILDLGNNLLAGKIPSWIGKRLSNLRILNLQSNKFMGKIPLELCQINKLQHLNLANNNITGNIPRCFCNLTGMIMSDSHFPRYHMAYEESIEASIKGIQWKYTTTIGFLRSLDLSSNKINGEIPDVLMNLTSLTNLNLSRNLLSGHIPKRIGNLKSMESLDLSTNKLSGRIPPSLVSLNFLSYMNLSFNKLFGPIPVGNQFNTFNDPTMYEGNNGLCGKPLPRNCKGSNLLYTHVGDGESKDTSHGLSWFYTGMVSGFVIGFMGLIGSLHFIRIWRITYFEMIENVCSWLAVSILVTLARLRKKSF